MGAVTLNIHGRSYDITCDDGQERRLRDLGLYVDERLRNIAKSGAANNEAHLLVLTTLLLADENFDLRDHLDSVHQEMQKEAQRSSKGKAQAAPSQQGQDEGMIAQAIDQLAGRIEHIAGRIQKA